MALQVSGAGEVLSAVIGEFVRGIVGTVPQLAAAALFVLIAYVGIRIVQRVVRGVLDRAMPDDEDMIVDLAVVLVGGLLWFGAVLVVLKILGMGEVAASLGTATGFVALGVAFALKEMIADTVAGVYLLRDPDFNPGDVVETASVTGTIESIDLRKTRIREDAGNLVVVSNRDVEKRWTRTGDT